MGGLVFCNCRSDESNVTIYVGNVQPTVDKDALFELFCRYCAPTDSNT